MAKRHFFYKATYWSLQGHSLLGVVVLLSIASPVLFQGFILLRPETSISVAQYQPPPKKAPPPSSGKP